MRYILDSNIFITPYRGFCPLDVGVSFWRKLKTLADDGVIVSLDKVKEEIFANADDLKSWMTACLPRRFFLPFATELSTERMKEIMVWVASSSFYTSRAKEKFMNMEKADVYLAAYASASPDDWTIVSSEIPSPNSPGIIKLPDICRRFGAKCIQLQDMFREIRETF